MDNTQAKQPHVDLKGSERFVVANPDGSRQPGVHQTITEAQAAAKRAKPVTEGQAQPGPAVKQQLFG